MTRGENIVAGKRTPFLVQCFVLLLSLLCAGFLGGCQGATTTTVGPSQASATGPQVIFAAMPPAPVRSTRVFEYARSLKSGDEVSGYANVYGEWEVPGDSATPWTFEMYDPAGILINSATTHFFPFDAEDPYYYFNVKAPMDGQYTIRIIHYSLMDRFLRMEVSPPGWQLTSPATT
jgi:hypothetical protein